MLLQRLLTTYPRSSLLPEAHWWLARTYEQTGNVTEALAQYRLVAQTAKEGELSLQARRRITELEQTLAVTPRRATGRTAMLIPSHRLPDQQHLDGWLGQLAQAGVTTLVLETGTVQGDRPEQNGGGPAGQPTHQAGVYFKTHWAPTVRDVVGPLVPIAHRHGLQVFSAVTLWRMNWLEPQLGWTEPVFDPAKRQLVASEALDLFHPAFQEYLIGLLTDLAAGGVDGILFRADAPPGPAEGFSPYGLKGFERDFGIKLEPITLAGSINPGLSPKAQRDPAPEFWRWAGWRARELLRVMDRLREALRKRFPQLEFALEVHPEATTDPVRALVRLNEDLLEAKRLRFDYYVIGEPLSMGPGGREGMPGSIERAVELIGEAGKVWGTAPLRNGDLLKGASELKAESDRAPFAKGVGILYVPVGSTTASTVP